MKPRKSPRSACAKAARATATPCNAAMGASVNVAKRKANLP